MAMKNHLLLISTIALCVACEISSPTESISCPTPSAEDSVNLWPEGVTDRELLSDSSYISKMIQHGSDSNLKAILIKSESVDTLGAINSADLARVENALRYRSENKCADVPDYLPYYSALPVVPL
jgi:hypothetical protein